jgi:serine/threonine protein kinase
MCQHKNIVKLIDIFESIDNNYIVMEYCKGKDLFEYIARRDYTLSENKVRPIML